MSASAELLRVPAHLRRQIWPQIADRIRSAVLRTDLSHTIDIERELIDGDGQLWIVHVGPKIEAAVATLLARTDKHLVCTITAIGGENMGNWLALIDQIEAWAKAEGAALVRIYGRPGWARVLKSYRVKNVILERLL